MTADELQRTPPPLRRAFATQLLHLPAPAPGLHALTEAHLRLHGRRGSRVSHNTLSTYFTAISHLTAWTQEHQLTLALMTHDQAALYARELEDAGRSASTVAVHLAAARALYSALRWAGAVTDSPFTDVHHAADPTPAHEKREAYSDDELVQLITLAQQRSDLHMVALLTLCGHAGLRAAEAIGVLWRDVQGERLRLIGKGGKRRTVVLSGRTVEALAALRALESDGDLDAPVLTWRSTSGARKAVQTLCQLAGLPYRGLHALRHTCGTRLMRDTNNIVLVARHLGHTDVNTTARYAKPSEDSLHPVRAW